jgi:serine protease Do
MRIANVKLVMAMAAALSVAAIPAFAGVGPDAPQAPAAPPTRPAAAPTPAPDAPGQAAPVIAPAPEGTPAPPTPPMAALAPAPEPPTAAGQPMPPPEPPSEPVWMQASQSYLGVDTRDVTKERMSALKLKEERGVELTLVDQDAPAGKAGLKVGDVLLDFNGQRVESQEQLRRLIREIPPGRTVTLGISRDGQPMSIQATLGDRRKMARGVYTYTPTPMPPMPPIRVNPRINVQPFSIVISDRTGLLVENLTPQLGEFFGVKNGEGVLVRSVEKGSAAETAGFRAGDVVVKVGEKRIARISDWRNAIRASKGTVAIGVVRDKKDHALSLALPERPAGVEEDSSFHFEWPEGAFEFQFDDMEPQISRLRERIALTVRQSAQLRATEVQRAMRQAQRELDRELRRLRIELERETELKDREQKLEEKKKVLEKEKGKRKTEVEEQ